MILLGCLVRPGIEHLVTEAAGIATYTGLRERGEGGGGGGVNEMASSSCRVCCMATCPCLYSPFEWQLLPQSAAGCFGRPQSASPALSSPPQPGRHAAGGLSDRHCGGTPRPRCGAGTPLGRASRPLPSPPLPGPLLWTRLQGTWHMQAQGAHGTGTIQQH